VYTTEKPIRAGWYWLFWKIGDLTNEEVVRVVQVPGGFKVLTTTGGCWNLATLGGSWLGPLPEPSKTPPAAEGDSVAERLQALEERLTRHLEDKNDDGH
jgi:hypothetical protein